MLDGDTIVALATPPGTGAVAIVRLSGPAALRLGGGLFVAGGRRTGQAGEPAATALRRRRAMLTGRLIDPADGRAVDRCLALIMVGPRSYTGEDVVELHLHGGVRLAQQVIDLLVAGGARPAEPGEFTLRAVLNGRLDLTQAEAVLNLIGAQTDAAIKLAADQLGGGLGETIRDIAAPLTALVAGIEVGIDYPDEEHGPPDTAAQERALAAAADRLASLLETARAGMAVAAGVGVVIAGWPNVGKSSLFNAMLGHRRAIVAAEPGTTRDLIEATLEVRGVGVRLCDTAGVRDAAGEVEREGVLMATAAARGADLTLLVVDAAAPGRPDPAAPYRDWLEGGPVIVVANKIDRRGAAWDRAGEESLRRDLGIPAAVPVVGVSALAGQGLDELLEAVYGAVTGGAGLRQGAGMLTTARQGRDVRQALAAVRRARRALAAGVPADVLLVEVYAALDALSRAAGTGPAAVREGVLDQLFARFCVGK